MSHSPADNHAPSQQSRTVLLATDNKNSILAEVAGDEPNPIAYSAYGQQSAQYEIATRLGFNGELREPHLGWYLLGNGYRAYNPTLMRFHSPDSWSPFGRGGLNAYMYCVGDPINNADPTGHGILKAIGKALVFLDKAFLRTEGGSNGAKAIGSTSSSEAFTTAGVVIAGAPYPHRGVPRQSSYNHGLPSPAGYEAAGGGSGDPFGSARRSPRENPNLKLGSSTSSNQTEGVHKNSKGEVVVTHRNSSGEMVTVPREPVRGGGDGTGIQTRGSTTMAHGQVQTFRQRVNEVRHQELTTSFQMRDAELLRHGYSAQARSSILAREAPGMVRQINMRLGVWVDMHGR